MRGVSSRPAASVASFRNLSTHPWMQKPTVALSISISSSSSLWRRRNVKSENDVYLQIYSCSYVARPAVSSGQMSWTAQRRSRIFYKIRTHCGTRAHIPCSVAHLRWAQKTLGVVHRGSLPDGNTAINYSNTHTLVNNSQRVRRPEQRQETDTIKTRTTNRATTTTNRITLQE